MGSLKFNWMLSDLEFQKAKHVIINLWVFCWTRVISGSNKIGNIRITICMWKKMSFCWKKMSSAYDLRAFTLLTRRDMRMTFYSFQTACFSSSTFSVSCSNPIQNWHQPEIFLPLKRKKVHLVIKETFLLEKLCAHGLCWVNFYFVFLCRSTQNIYITKWCPYFMQIYSQTFNKSYF